MENVHFRSTIDIEPAGGSPPTFDDLVWEIVGWIRGKEGPSANLKAPWALRQGSWKKPDGRASVEIDSIWDLPEGPSPSAWALRYSHQDNDFPARRWTIDIGVATVAPGHWRLSMTVGNSLHSSFMGQEPGRLPVTAPRLLTTLAKSERWHLTGGSLALLATPTVLDVGKANILRNAIASPKRCCALIYVSRERASGEVLVDPVRLASSIVGSGTVFVASSSEIDEELEYLIPFEFRAPNGMVRVYAPGANLSDGRQSFRHRFFTRQQIQRLGAEEVEQQIARSLVRRSGWTRLVTPISSIDDVRSQRREQRLVELQKKGGAESERELLALFEQANQELTTQNRVLEQARLASEQRLEDLEDQIEGLNDSVRTLEYERDFLRNDATEAKRRASALEAAATAARSIAKLPTTLAEVMSLITRLHPDTIAFTDEAIASARSAAIDDLPKGLEVAWAHLRAAATVLPRLAFEESVSAGQLPSRFLTESGCEMSMTEGTSTKADSRLVNSRLVTFDGKKWDITPHIKYGSKAPKLLRIHFALDRERGRIIVGHCGDHLETAGTRRSG